MKYKKLSRSERISEEENFFFVSLYVRKRETAQTVDAAVAEMLNSEVVEFA